MGRECLGQALGLGSFISNMEETYTDTLDPGRLLQCPYDLKKKIRYVPAGFLIILSSTKRIILIIYKIWLSAP